MIYRLLSLMVVFLSFSNCQDGPPKTAQQDFIIIEPLAGFGNRIRAIASAYATSVRTGAKLVVKWDEQAGHMPGVKNIYELYEPSKYYISFDEFKTKYPDAYKKFEAKEYGYYYNENLDEHNAYYVLPTVEFDEHKIIYITSSVNFKPKSMRFDEYVMLFRFLYQNLTPVKEIRDEVEKFYDANMKGKSVYGIHYRDWTGEGHIGEVTKTVEYRKLFIKKIKEIIAKDPNAIFLVASNKLEVIDDFKAGVPSSNPDLFIRYPLSAVDRNTLKGVRDALVEWYLLGKTKSIMGTAQSSFSEEAAFLTTELKKYSIGPSGYSSNFHSVYCFNSDGDVIDRPYSDGGRDPCEQYAITK